MLEIEDMSLESYGLPQPEVDLLQSSDILPDLPVEECEEKFLEMHEMLNEEQKLIFDELTNVKSEIKGNIRTVFVEKSKQSRKECIGVLTNRIHKLDILLTKKYDESLNFDRGTKVEIVGDLRENGES
ncbi:hypothetical protein QAD02_007332 [Eretmocerus hayati]|uniref:Uncharacterized protein n=1 Tax=Eretmocerus hayati TaxID=131215 RepID=A0ACC2N7N8_9HYME|nr:hypothetical protein QAD02_007332 [Eretmocerus hayati]